MNNEISKKIYLALNLSVIFISLFLFVSQFELIKIAISQLIVFFICSALVIMLKCLRLYIVLFGNSFNKRKFFSEYFKTTCINMILPYKIGEFFRGYIIGNLVGSYFEGYLLVLIDRFVDTVALLTVVVVSTFFVKIMMNTVYFLLLAVLIIILFIYLLFPPLYKYWNKYLILNKISKNALKGLAFLDVCNSFYAKLKEIIHGRFPILYFISIVSWLIEIIVISNFGNVGIGNYLSNIIDGRWGTSNLFFNISGMIFSCFMFILVLMKNISQQTRGKKALK